MSALREWECPECGQVFRGQYPPEECPVCGEALSDVDLYDLEDGEDWLNDESDDDALDDELGDAEEALLDDEDIDADPFPEDDAGLLADRPCRRAISSGLSA